MPSKGERNFDLEEELVLTVFSSYLGYPLVTPPREKCCPTQKGGLDLLVMPCDIYASTGS
jgi:hypothetical protein